MEKQKYAMSTEQHNSKRQYWALRESPPSFFSWPGWLFLLGLLLLAIWGIFVTAPDIERQVEYNVQQQLAAANDSLAFENTKVSASGQNITLTAEGEQSNESLAEAVASGATCNTPLFGRLRCPANVTVELSQQPASGLIEPEATVAVVETIIEVPETEPEPAAESRAHYFEFISDHSGLVLSGEVASEEVQLTIGEELGELHSPIDNQLAVSGQPSSSQDLLAARQAGELLSLAEQGSVSWKNGSLNARLLSKAENSAAIHALFDTISLTDPNAELELQLVETVSRCDQQFEQLFAENTITFRIGSATISPESNRLLGEIAKLAGECDLRLDIEGYTDNAGSAELNKSLSLARANAVIVSLAAHGANPERFTAYGYGPDRPIASNETAQGRRQNRRIEIRASKIN